MTDTTATQQMTHEEVGIVAKGAFVAALERKGLKPSRAAQSVDKLLPLLTREEIKKLIHWMEIDMLAEAGPAERRELLSKMEVCPCCERWLGHNNPPPDRKRDLFD
jgi:hypothetical protein